MNLTKRSHYNPCFWTAFWSRAYYEAFQKGLSDNLRAREQKVYALNVKSDVILSDVKVEDIYYEKIGFADITYKSAKNLAKYYRPDIYEAQYKGKNKDIHKPDDVLYPVEELLTEFEQVAQAQPLVTVIKHSGIVSPDEKDLLAYCLFVQSHRSHAAMNSGFEDLEEKGIGKFGYFVLLHWKLSDQNYVNTYLNLWRNSKWKFYQTTSDTFPLSDTAVLINHESIMVALSPRLLLEIPLGSDSDANGWSYKDSIDDKKLDEFRKRTIGNTFREIIFSNKTLLEDWQKTKEFRTRVNTIQKMKGYNLLVIKDGEKNWRFNAYSNQTFTTTPRKRRKN